MEKLPVEIKEHITSLLGQPQDLTKLALTSSSYLSLAQRSLYRNVSLRSDLPNIRHTFGLLRRSPRLRKVIRVISFKTDEEWGSRPGRIQRWIDMDIFNGMDNIRRVEFRLLPCVPARDFQDMFATIYHCCPRIEEILATDISWPMATPPPGWVLNPQLEVPSTLKRLTFESSFSSEMRKFFLSTFISPFSRIESLSLFVENNTETLEDISSLSFKCLKSLRVVDFSANSSRELVRFLLLNPTIESLSFPRADSINVEGEKVTVLPALRSLSGPPAFITQLVRICDSVKFVNALDLQFAGCYDSAHQASIRLVSSVGSFPSLKHLSVSHTYSFSLVTQLMHLFHDSKELQWWTGGFYCRDAAILKKLIHILSRSLPSLKRVDICEWTSCSILPYEQREALSTMAVKIPSVEKITLFYDHLDSNEIANVYFVPKKKSLAGLGGLIEAYQYYEGGPYLKDRRCVDKHSVDWHDDLLLE
ncbi:hypothetical protein CPB84DRAFT_1787359 [Gymnopilus junonius]|uniref:F-box domain-containing protein n=1 Tax=Gymnopilus junonius TaxID=109634 RepID=A0A9P5TJZ3_GYMJU|nr:hypothetical protein CPB84DRAFT_1787359 [Gymnopilus junonius]